MDLRKYNTGPLRLVCAHVTGTDESPSDPVRLKPYVINYGNELCDHVGPSTLCMGHYSNMFAAGRTLHAQLLKLFRLSNDRLIKDEYYKSSYRVVTQEDAFL